jgi:23S rRNA (pseudouridine1915-N3)-methyltransferase
VRVVLVTVGKVRDRSLRAVLDDYLERIRRYVGCDEVEVKHDGALQAAIPPEAFVIACEVGGDPLSSPDFARRLEQWARNRKGIVTFLIGGAEGIPAPVSRGADVRLSLSAMTLPHRLARVLLAEQIYRAMTILRGEPYARE